MFEYVNTGGMMSRVTSSTVALLVSWLAGTGFSSIFADRDVTRRSS